MRLLGDIAKAVLKAFLSDGGRGQEGGSSSTGTTSSSGPKPRPPASRPGTPAASSSPGAGDGYPGDFTGRVDAAYSPDLDGDPDPGEIVWTWVPFEEDFGQGKDRPVLLVGRDGEWLLGVQLTSKDNVSGGSQNGNGGRRYLDIGTGDWDRQGRPSEILLSRVIRVDPAAVRREGAVLDKTRFDRVIAEL
ncbi:hypothetical protein GCM10009751_28000 [Myceligenerans crystallogenes]|uniref:PemK-like, MazF-like toxin of type II toxin-antitoxin system n=2 Tax=Myceligenerans crystallogenes TaxID=316335 RepID=A0ABN2NG82_9MICO